jgi:hypothetical protein
MDNKYGTSRMPLRLPKSLRIRFFSVNEYAIDISSPKLGYISYTERVTDAPTGLRQAQALSKSKQHQAGGFRHQPGAAKGAEALHPSLT